jgi:hypothetical protein
MSCWSVFHVRGGRAVAVVAAALAPPAAAVAGLAATFAAAAAIDAQAVAEIEADVRAAVLPLLWQTRLELARHPELRDATTDVSLGVAVIEEDSAAVWSAGPIVAGILQRRDDRGGHPLVEWRGEAPSLGAVARGLAHPHEAPRSTLSSRAARGVFVGTPGLPRAVVTHLASEPGADRRDVARLLLRQQQEDVAVAWAAMPSPLEGRLAS